MRDEAAVVRPWVPGTTSAWETLARQRRVVFYDQRGNGRSGALAPGQTCTLAQYLADPTCGATRAQLGNWGTRISQLKMK